MNRLRVSVKRLPHGDGLPLPAYMTPGSAGMDLVAAVEGETILNPGERLLVPTGLALALPDGYEAQIRPRSGLAWKYGVTLLNSPGTIDADYRGEIFLLLVNLGQEPFVIKRGDRLAQMVVAPYLTVSWQEEELNETPRGEGGFGHTDL